MTRAEHNARWNVERRADDRVHCHLFGYGEISQYDARCAGCWLGNAHTWAEHDRMVGAKLEGDRK